MASDETEFLTNGVRICSVSCYAQRFKRGIISFT